MTGVTIRPYSKNDRDFVRGIAYNTAFFGGPADIFFDDRELVEDFLTAYFIDYEPQSCFVAETEKKVIGYLMGAKDTFVLDRIVREKIIPKLLIKAITRGIIFKKKIRFFIANIINSFLKGEFKSPDFSKEYPATLHVNVEEGFRNQGLGAKLISAYLDYLVKHKIRGVHLATLSDKAAHFYEKSGFILLHKEKRTYFRAILDKDIFCYIFGIKFPGMD